PLTSVFRYPGPPVKAAARRERVLYVADKRREGRRLTMLRALPGGRSRELEEAAADKLACLMALEQKALWLSTWMIHHANHIRPSRDGLKVGGHQASSASVATLMTALYLDVMRPQDRVAVKPHAAPLFHALQYLL